MDDAQGNGSKVTAAELVRNFARSRELARNGPVHITHHGRDTHVLCEVSEFRRLQAQAARVVNAALVNEAESSLFALADWMDEALVIYDKDLSTVFANRAAVAMLGVDEKALHGRTLREAIPSIADSLIEAYAERARRLRQPGTAEIPSPFRKGAWLRFQSFPLGERIVLKFQDITEDVQRHRQADVKDAVLQAMNEHGSIGCIRASVRGTIDSVNEPFCQLVHLSRERLEGVLITDLVVAADRVPVREMLEKSLRGERSHAAEVRLLTNQGHLTTVRLSMMQLTGMYGVEGIVILVTERSQTEAPARFAEA